MTDLVVMMIVGMASAIVGALLRDVQWEFKYAELHMKHIRACAIIKLLTGKDPE